MHHIYNEFTSERVAINLNRLKDSLHLFNIQYNLVIFRRRSDWESLCRRARPQQSVLCDSPIGNRLPYKDPQSDPNESHEQ